MSNTLIIFTDASFDPKTKWSVCGHILIMKSEWEQKADRGNQEVVLNSFQNLPSIAAAELHAVILALEELHNFQFDHLQIYSDSPAVTGLLRRKDKLEANQFMSKRSGKVLNHADAYQNILQLIEGISVSITALKGHVAKGQRTDLDESFACVDQATREGLRRLIKQPNF